MERRESAGTETCSRCGAPLEERRLPEVRGTAGATTVSLRHYPVLACPRGHERFEVRPDFNPDFLDTVLSHDHDAFARAKGLLRKRQHCSGCGGDLEDAAQGTGSLMLRLRGPGHVGVSVEVSGPVLACSRCEREQLKDWKTDRDELVEAIMDALEKSDIRRY